MEESEDIQKAIASALVNKLKLRDKEIEDLKTDIKSQSGIIDDLTKSDDSVVWRAEWEQISEIAKRLHEENEELKEQSRLICIGQPWLGDHFDVDAVEDYKKLKEKVKNFEKYGQTAVYEGLLNKAVKLEKEVKQKKEFYNKRMNALQQAQKEFREPERTIVCDIMANGCVRKNIKELNTEPTFSTQAMEEKCGLCSNDIPLTSYLVLKETLEQIAKQIPGFTAGSGNCGMCENMIALAKKTLKKET